MNPTRHGGAFRLVVFLTSLAALSCGDDPVEPEPVGSILRFGVTLDGMAVMVLPDSTQDTIPLVGLAGELNVSQPFDSVSANGVNPVDLGLFTEQAPAPNAPGIRFATNTMLAGANTLGATGTDVADVAISENGLDVEATLLTAVVGAPPCGQLPADNLFAADSVYKMVSGSMLVTVGSASANGSVTFEGAVCDGVSEANATLTATFSGSRIP